MRNWLTGAIRAITGGKRSSKWPATRKAWLREHPCCRACGSYRNPEVHHIHPYQYFPDLELSPTNLITLCEYVPWYAPWRRTCHLEIGHHGNYKRWNPTVERDADRAYQEMFV